MLKTTYQDGSLQAWRFQWQDNSTEEDGFVIRYRTNGGSNGDSNELFRKIPTALSLTSGVTTEGSTTVTCFKTDGLSAGWSVVGTNIPSGAIVESVTNSTTFVLSQAATGTATGLTLTTASPYKAAKNYTYVVDIPILSSDFSWLSFGNYYVYTPTWSIYAYKDTSPTIAGPVEFAKTMLPPATASLDAPSNLAVTAPTAGEFHVVFRDNSWFESYAELDYKLHASATWSTLKVDFTSKFFESLNNATTFDLTGNAADTNLTQTEGNIDKLYLPGLQTGTEYDFRIRAVDFQGNKSPYSNVVQATSLP